MMSYYRDPRKSFCRINEWRYKFSFVILISKSLNNIYPKSELSLSYNNIYKVFEYTFLTVTSFITLFS